MATSDIAALEAKLSALESHFDRLRWKFQCPTCKHTYSHSDPISNMKPSDAVVTCLREFDRPVGVGILRTKLESKGYPMQRFGRRYSYFYTVLCRLVDAKRIERLDGDEVMLMG